MTAPIVKRFFVALDRHKSLAFFTWALIVGVSGVFALLPSPPTPPLSYRVTGILSFSTPPPAFTSTGDQIQRIGRLIDTRFLLGPKVLTRVGEKLNLSPNEMIMIREDLEILLPEEGQAPLIGIEYFEENPDKARVVISTFLQEMVEESRLRNTQTLRARIEALDNRLAVVKEELRDAEEVLYRYISSTEVLSLLAVQDGSLFLGITSSQQQQRDLELALKEIEGQINSLIEQLGMTPDQAYTSAALSADPIVANLRIQILQNENQLQLLTQDLRPEHPRIIRLTRQKEALEKLLQERAAEVIGTDGILTALPEKIRQDSNLDPARRSLANRLVTLNTQREGLLKQLESLQRIEQQLRLQYEQFPEQQLERSRLAQQVQLKRGLYQNILNALVDAQSAEAETTSSLAIVQDAAIEEIEPESLTQLSPIILLGAGVGVGFLASAGVIFLMASLDSKLHSFQELRAALAEREIFPLGELPFAFCLNSNGEETPILVDPDAPTLPFYERLRSNIRRLEPDKKVFLVASVSSEEGKTVTAYNLAIASAAAGKRTLLIEADLRSPSEGQYLKVPPDPSATVDPLGYYSSLTNCINIVPEIANLYIVTSPGPLRQAAAIIESNELKKLFEDARRLFDLVVVDTPSLENYNDALLLESFSDGIALVTRPGYTDSNLLEEAIEQMVEAEVNLLGGVINGVDDKSIPQPDLEDEEIYEPGFVETPMEEVLVVTK